jgi:hypothetical protein
MQQKHWSGHGVGAKNHSIAVLIINTDLLMHIQMLFSSIVLLDKSTEINSLGQAIETAFNSFQSLPLSER